MRRVKWPTSGLIEIVESMFYLRSGPSQGCIQNINYSRRLKLIDLKEIHFYQAKLSSNLISTHQQQWFLYNSLQTPCQPRGFMSTQIQTPCLPRRSKSTQMKSPCLPSGSKSTQRLNVNLDYGVIFLMCFFLKK